jgi:hypothetical protein
MGVEWRRALRVRMVIFLAVGQLVLLTPLIVDACCVCTGCPNVSGPQCSGSSGCDSPIECFFGCSIAGSCSGSQFVPGGCTGVAGCGVPVPVSRAPMELALAVMLAGTGIFYLRRYGGARNVRAAVLAMILLCGAAALHAASQVHVSGTWLSGGAQHAGEGLPSWQATLTRGDGDTLTGTVTINGSAHVGNTFDGHISGDSVSGTIRDNEGNLVATVVGTLRGNVLDGQYTTAGGDVGSFTWDTAQL